MPAQGNAWFGGPGVVIAFRPEVNGYAAVDVVNQSWPDAMGDPKSDRLTFGAWAVGQFGPFAFPGCLSRAGQHAWSWGPGRTIAEGHRGFIRIRTSYVFGTKDNAPIFPEGYDPLAEMMFVSRAVFFLFEVPGVICYFNPNGEVLRNSASFRELWEDCRKQEKLPLALWMNIRFFTLNEKLGFMDTVGNSQLEIRDVEGIFPKVKYDPGKVDYYLRNVTHYLLDLGRELQTGEAIDGPDEDDLSWTMEVLDDGVIDPTRRVLRLYPKANRRDVREALAALRRSPS